MSCGKCAHNVHLFDSLWKEEVSDVLFPAAEAADPDAAGECVLLNDVAAVFWGVSHILYNLLSFFFILFYLNTDVFTFFCGFVLFVHERHLWENHSHQHHHHHS